MWENWIPYASLQEMHNGEATTENSLADPQKVKQSCHVIQQFYS